MRLEHNAETLEATGLVLEAYMKLVDQSRVDWKGRTHFLAVSAQVMRRILEDNARKKNRNKRGGDVQKISLDDVRMAMSPEKEEHVLAIEEALEKLEKRDHVPGESVVMRILTGAIKDLARLYGASKRNSSLERNMIKLDSAKTQKFIHSSQHRGTILKIKNSFVKMYELPSIKRATSIMNEAGYHTSVVKGLNELTAHV